MKIFKKIVDILASYVEEHLNIFATPSGLEIKIMDASHVSMVNLDFPKKFFKFYRCKKKAKIGVNIGNLNKVLKRLSGEDELGVSLDTKGNKLHLESKGEFSNTFSLNLIDIDEEEYPEPKMAIKAKIIVEIPNQITKGIKNIELFSDYVDFETNGKEFKLTGKGDSGEAVTTITENLSFEVTEKSISKYPLKYLTTILQATPITQELTIEYSSELPLFMTFRLKDESEEVFLKCFLAPRVEGLEEPEEELETEEELDSEVEELAEEESENDES